MSNQFGSIFDLGDREAVINFLEWQRTALVLLVSELNQYISDINHAIEWTRLGGDYGEEKEENWTIKDW